MREKGIHLVFLGIEAENCIGGLKVKRERVETSCCDPLQNMDVRIPQKGDYYIS